MVHTIRNNYSIVFIAWIEERERVCSMHRAEGIRTSQFSFFLLSRQRSPWFQRPSPDRPLTPYSAKASVKNNWLQLTRRLDMGRWNYFYFKVASMASDSLKSLWQVFPRCSRASPRKHVLSCSQNALLIYWHQAASGMHPSRNNLHSLEWRGWKRTSKEWWGNKFNPVEISQPIQPEPALN